MKQSLLDQFLKELQEELDNIEIPKYMGYEETTAYLEGIQKVRDKIEELYNRKTLK